MGKSLNQRDFAKDKGVAENAAAKMALRSLEECENSTLQRRNENAKIW